MLAVLDSGRLVAGAVTRELEETFAREVAHTSEAVAVANGTAALHVALLAHDIGSGDEVITTPFTFQATANMVLATGARPVFVDVGEDGNIDPLLIDAAITPRTRALLPVHLYGRLCDMRAIVDLAQRHGLALIEDAAQAHAAESGGRRAGSFGIRLLLFLRHEEPDGRRRRHGDDQRQRHRRPLKTPAPPRPGRDLHERRDRLQLPSDRHRRRYRAGPDAPSGWVQRSAPP